MLIRLVVGLLLGACLLVVNAAGLVTGEEEEVSVVGEEHGDPAAVPGFRGGGGIDWISGLGGGVKRVRLN